MTYFYRLLCIVVKKNKVQRTKKNKRPHLMLIYMILTSRSCTALEFFMVVTICKPRLFLQKILTEKLSWVQINILSFLPTRKPTSIQFHLTTQLWTKGISPKRFHRTAGSTNYSKLKRNLYAFLFWSQLSEKHRKCMDKGETTLILSAIFF